MVVLNQFQWKSLIFESSRFKLTLNDWSFVFSLHWRWLIGILRKEFPNWRLLHLVFLGKSVCVAGDAWLWLGIGALTGRIIRVVNQIMVALGWLKLMVLALQLKFRACLEQVVVGKELEIFSEALLWSEDLKHSWLRLLRDFLLYLYVEHAGLIHHIEAQLCLFIEFLLYMPFLSRYILILLQIDWLLCRQQVLLVFLKIRLDLSLQPCRSWWKLLLPSITNRWPLFLAALHGAQVGYRLGHRRFEWGARWLSSVVDLLLQTCTSENFSDFFSW